jgi:hypothetical protein
MNSKEKYLKYKTKYLELKQNQIQIGSGYSKIYVLNKLSNIVEYIDLANFDMRIHENIEDKKLKKIAEKNYLKIKKIIGSEQNYKKKFYHVGTKEFAYPIIDKHLDMSSWLGKNIYKNPQGIWISCGLAWQKYIGADSSYPSPWTLGTYIYEIEPTDDVLLISNLKELKNFINLYMRPNPKISDIIDWKKVKKNYSGLIICPYLGDKIWGPNANKFGFWGNQYVDEYLDKIIGDKWRDKLFFTAEWYRHWEEATGVIWKPSTGVKSIRLIEKINLN